MVGRTILLSELLTNLRTAKAITMRLKVELMPFLRRKYDGTIYDMEVPDGSTVRALLSDLGFRDEEMNSLMISVNNKHVRLEEKLKDNDTIWVGIVIGGG